MNMTFQDLDIIKSRTLMLKAGIPSGEVILTDPTGDMYFTFELRYTEPNAQAKTHLSSTDPLHASVIIETRPNALTEPSEPISIGKYGYEGKPLYLGFVVQPQIADSGQHTVIVTFYIRKEVKDGI